MSTKQKKSSSQGETIYPENRNDGPDGFPWAIVREGEIEGWFRCEEDAWRVAWFECQMEHWRAPARREALSDLRELLLGLTE